jgi:hypothetical protein
MPSDDLPQKVELTRAEAVGMADVLWEVLGTTGINHDTQMRAMDYALQLDLRVLMPPWPTDDSSREKVVDHLRKVQGIVERKLAELGE